MPPLITHERRPCVIRHHRHLGTGWQTAPEGLGAGDIGVFPQSFFRPQPLEGLNGGDAWVSATFERRLNEEGGFTLRLPNGIGGDQVPHVERFAILTDPDYEPGDEWLEIWEGERPFLTPHPLYVGTPTEVSRWTETELELAGVDALDLLKTVRDTAASFWRHAPRDVFEHYAGAWAPRVVESFERTDMTYLVDQQETALPAGPDGQPRPQWRYRSARTLGNGDLEFVGSGGGAVCSIEPSYNGDLAVAPYVSNGRASSENDWRMEASVTRAVFITPAVTPTFILGVTNADQPEQYLNAEDFSGGGIVAVALELRATSIELVSNHEGTIYRKSAKLEAPNAAGPFALAIEARGRWVYFYVDAQLIGVLPRPFGVFNPPEVGASNSNLPFALTTLPFDASSRVHYFLTRQWRPWLLFPGFDWSDVDLEQAGDFRLPGVPQPGGLIGAYFDDRDLQGLHGATYRHHALNPTRTPNRRRQDRTIDFSGTGWQPNGLPADYYSVRWTGAIYLDDASSAIRVANYDDGVRLWVGRTRDGEQIVNDWNDGAPRTSSGFDLGPHLGAEDLFASGGGAWYPIVLEFYDLTGNAGLVLQTGPSPTGPWTTVPAERLSPQGIYEGNPRNTSHYEQLQEIGRTFGYQFQLEPRRLEAASGQGPLFPGQLRPKVRAGVDVDKVLTEADLAGGKPERKIDARNVGQGLVLDAAGIARDGAQLTIEQLDLEQVGRHLVMHQDAVSVADITIPEVLAARGRTLQALRRRAWEEVSFRPAGATELVDRFPVVADSLQRLDWSPGLGLRLLFRTLRLEDELPRQLTGVERTVTPERIGPPVVSFRPRPRDFRAQLRELARDVRGARRTYQSQATVIPGSKAARNGGAAFPDEYSSVSWPLADDAVIGAELVVEVKTDASAMTIEVNGASIGKTITAAGRYDLWGYVAREAANPRCYVRLGGGTGIAEYKIELTVRI